MRDDDRNKNGIKNSIAWGLNPRLLRIHYILTFKELQRPRYKHTDGNFPSPSYEEEDEVLFFLIPSNARKHPFGRQGWEKCLGYTKKHRSFLENGVFYI